MPLYILQGYIIPVCGLVVTKVSLPLVRLVYSKVVIE